MDKRFDVVALGELTIDYMEVGMSNQGNPLYEANPGGAPCNVLAMLNHLDKRTAFIGKVGDDAFGHRLREIVKQSGTDVTNLLFDRKIPTTLAFAHLCPDGGFEFSFCRNPGADMMLTKGEINEDLIRNSQIFHFGTFSSSYDISKEATRHAIGIAKDNGILVSFDPNLREMLWDSLEHAKEEIVYGLSKCDILKIADNELEFLTGTENYDIGVQMINQKYHIPLICVTLGAEGSIAYYKEQKVRAHPFLLEKTIETTGAGDAFMACMLNCILEHGLERLTMHQIEEMLIFANAAAALVTTRKGALRVMPGKREIEELIKTYSQASYTDLNGRVN